MGTDEVYSVGSERNRYDGSQNGIKSDQTQRKNTRIAQGDFAVVVFNEE